jgi:ABC-2 type transport system ATP-binding protein
MDFNGKTVIKDLSFDVKRGETFGFLGSNGSGKTTTIRALLGIYRPISGTLHIDGRPFKPEDGGRLGYLPEERGLYKKEKVMDVMTHFGRLKGLNRLAARLWSQNYLERVYPADKGATQLDKLSGGQQQKVQLGVTIMNNPELLILDEPTKGFDPVNRRLLMDIIEEQKDKGATVMMVTHHMEEVERICDRIILLKNGTSEAYGTVPEAQRRYGGRTAKDAGTFTGFMMAMIFIPFYIVTLIISTPQALIVQIFTYFPFSAPVTALLRNGFGSLAPSRPASSSRFSMQVQR